MQTAVRTAANDGAGPRPKRAQPDNLSGERLVEFVQNDLGARFADVGQMRIDDGGVEGLVTEILADLAQGDALFQEVRGVRMAQRLPILLMSRTLQKRSSIATIRFSRRK